MYNWAEEGEEGLKRVSEALYGDKVLLELVKRRGRASLNRDLSLSQTSMLLSLAAETVHLHERKAGPRDPRRP